MANSQEMKIHSCYRIPEGGIRAVPFDLLCEDIADRNHGQSLESLNERGGLSPSEMLANIERRRYYSMDEDWCYDVLQQIVEKYGK